MSKLFSRGRETAASLFERRAFLLFLAVLSTFVWGEWCGTSFFHRGTPLTDSAVFSYISYAMSKGQIPYSEIFDHKGPLLYLINFLGYSINSEIGVWILELVNIFVTTWLIFRISRLVCSSNALAVAATFLSLSLMFPYFEEGNYVEEYAMPLIAGGLYVFLDYFIHNKTTVFKLLLCGLCGGGVLMFRPNMAVTWLVFPIAVVINELIGKNPVRLLQYCACFLLGVAAAILPFVVYFAWHGALWDFFDVYILFNLEYSASGGSLRSVLQIAYGFANPMGFVIGGILLLSLRRGKNLLLNISYLIYIGLSLLSISMSGREYWHYGLILIPLMTYPISLFLANHNAAPAGREALCLWLLVVLLSSWLFPTTRAARHVLSGVTVENSRHLQEVADHVQASTDPDSRIIVIGNKNWVYVKCDRLSASRYSYQYPIADARESIYQEFYGDLEQAQPSAVIIPAGREYFPGLQDYLARSQYQVTLSNSQYTVLQPEQ